MLIVAMLAQTTTAVPEQRLLLPQHWLLAAWDMVSRCWWRCPRVAIDQGAAHPVQYARMGCRGSTPKH